jgi:pimeloyl-ACP methyl ester carboxylesterase
LIQDAGHLPMVERREAFHRVCRDFLVGVEEEIPGALVG